MLVLVIGKGSLYGWTLHIIIAVCLDFIILPLSSFSVRFISFCLRSFLYLIIRSGYSLLCALSPSPLPVPSPRPSPPLPFPLSFSSSLLSAPPPPPLPLPTSFSHQLIFFSVFFTHSCSPTAQMIPVVTPKTPVITTKAIYKANLQRRPDLQLISKQEGLGERRGGEGREELGWKEE